MTPVSYTHLDVYKRQVHFFRSFDGSFNAVEIAHGTQADKQIQILPQQMCIRDRMERFWIVVNSLKASLLAANIGDYFPSVTDLALSLIHILVNCTTPDPPSTVV